MPLSNWHWLTVAGGTFESDTDGTFHCDIPGTFQSVVDGTFDSATAGTFQSDMGGTFGPLLSTYESRLQVPYSQQFKFYRLVESKKICKFALHNKQRHTYRVDIHKRFAIGLLERNLAISTNHQQPALDACIPWVQADLWNRTGDWACQSLSKGREIVRPASFVLYLAHVTFDSFCTINAPAPKFSA